ncbi:MAG TPA: MerR family transcriptional regulator [Rhizomicrobium sp.]|jgi:MerR family redox-sensitive transcriptional activator SoxR
MRGLAIGEVGRRAGLATSAIRYYERAGLLPKPARASGQRRYEPEILGLLEMIRMARAAGFTISETRIFLTGADKPSARWQALAQRKRAEIDATIAKARRMKAALKSNFRCGCAETDDCARAIARKACG